MAFLGVLESVIDAAYNVFLVCALGAAMWAAWYRWTGGVR